MKRLLALLLCLVMAAAMIPAAAAEDSANAELSISATNFPDATFRSYVKDHFDTDKNGKLSQTEIDKVTSIQVNNAGITNLKGVERFPQLTELKANSNQLGSINLSKNTKLKNLYLNQTGLSSFDASILPALEYVDLGRNAITKLDLSKNTKLIYLNVGGTKLSSLDVTGLTDLKYLNLIDTGISKINVSKNRKLISLDVDNTSVSSLNLANNPDLQQLTCSNSKITSLNVTNNPKLQYLHANGLGLSSLDLSNNLLLERLSIDNNAFSTLNVRSMYNLQQLYCENNKLTKLDVTRNPLLNALSCAGNQIAKLDLSQCEKLADAVKNGSRSGATIYRYYWNGGSLSVDASTTLITDGAPLKPVIITSPISVSVEVGNSAGFAVTASGSQLSYQWLYRTSETGTWYRSSGSGATTDHLYITASMSRSGYQYRCKVTNPGGTAYSDIATLTVRDSGGNYPTITAQPKNVSAKAGASVQFSVKATGRDLSYQWYYRSGLSGTWYKSTLSSATTATLTITARTNRDGYQYRCKVKNDLGTVTSRTATLTLLKKPTITTQPVSKTAAAGTTVTFSVTATDATSYQWYYRSNPDAAWLKSTMEGAATRTLKVPAKAFRDGYQYYCKVTNSIGSTYSKSVTLTVTGK